MAAREVIRVEGVSKQYRLGKTGTGTLSHDLNRWWHQIRGKEDPYLKIGEVNDRTRKSESGYVWALRDINFSVQQGEVLGIIGRNGAGKSTLLKILSRTTLPTTGSIKTRGRIASLLEVGTGFHPEMTGRENIFMNGAILGMRRREIQQKLDEIIDFSGVEAYIDTPVKRYSSGMYVRLAFAVAAHLESEILIVDEVLAVGDAEFQRKCLGRMSDYSLGGRTVILVSHNLQIISSISNKVSVLEDGGLGYFGEVTSGVDFYLNSDNLCGQFVRGGDFGASPHIKRVSIFTTRPGFIQDTLSPFSIEFILSNTSSVKDLAFSYQILDDMGIPIVHELFIESEHTLGRNDLMIHNDVKLIVKHDELRLYPGRYSLRLNFADNAIKRKVDFLESICPFGVEVFGKQRDYYWGAGNARYIESTTWKLQM